MIRASNHSSYPRVGESPLDQQVRWIHRAAARGAATAQEVEAVEDEATCLAVAEQSRAFIDIVTDGMVRWDGLFSHLGAAVAGLESRELRRFLGTPRFERRVAVVGPLARARPLLARDFHVARGVAQKPLKVVLPGPVSFARLAVDEYYGSTGRLAEALADVLAAEVAELAAAGARWFQLDEPLLAQHAEDLDLVCATAGRVFAAAVEPEGTIVSTYFGSLAAVGAGVARIPGTHLGLDLVADPGGLALLPALPAGRGVSLGLFDARRTRVEDAAEVAAGLAPWRQALSSRDVLVGPNAGLELLPRDVAFDKLLQARYLVEQLGREWAA